MPIPLLHAHTSASMKFSAIRPRLRSGRQGATINASVAISPCSDILIGGWEAANRKRMKDGGGQRGNQKGKCNEAIANTQPPPGKSATGKRTHTEGSTKTEKEYHRPHSFNSTVNTGTKYKRSATVSDPNPYPSPIPPNRDVVRNTAELLNNLNNIKTTKTQTYLAVKSIDHWRKTTRINKTLHRIDIATENR